MNLALIGTGVMGQAIIKSILAKAFVAAEAIRLFDTDGDKAGKLAQEIGARSCSSPSEAVKGAEIVILAVKPPVMPSAIASIQNQIDDDAIVISIAAGITVERLRSLAGNKPAIVRAMPNMPVRIGRGVTALCFDQASPAQKQIVLDLWTCCGLVFEIREDLMDAVTGLSGSGPAYVMMMLDALSEAGVYLGLPRETAQKMAAMTLQGSAQMVLETGQHPAALIDQIATPGGTTIEAILSLEEDGLRAALMHAVCAAADKSRQLRELSG
jgi:pyrroline-5-carboxylate reductase